MVVSENVKASFTKGQWSRAAQPLVIRMILTVVLKISGGAAAEENAPSS